MFYESGTVALVEGATALTFTGTALLANVKVGDEFLAPGGSARVISITDDTHLTIYPAWTGNANATATYKIARGSGWAPTAEMNAAFNVLKQRLDAGLLMAPHAYGRAGTTDRNQYDDRPYGFLYFSVPEEGDSGNLPEMFVKLSNTDGDWSTALNFQGPAGADGVTLAAVLYALGINSITVSTSSPTGGSNNDLWFQVLS